MFHLLDEKPLSLVKILSCPSASTDGPNLQNSWIVDEQKLPQCCKWPQFGQFTCILNILDVRIRLQLQLSKPLLHLFTRRLDRIRREMSTDAVSTSPEPEPSLPSTPPPWTMEPPPSYDTVMKSQEHSEQINQEYGQEMNQDHSEQQHLESTEYINQENNQQV